MFADWLSVSFFSCFRRTTSLRRRPAARRRPWRGTWGSLAGAQTLESRLLLAGDLEPTILVDSLADDGSGGTTLREAVGLANTTPGADVIGFAENLAGGTIVLTGGQLNLTDDVTIQGLGADRLTIAVEQEERAFFVPLGVTAELTDLTVTGARLENDDGVIDVIDGGAVAYNLGVLTIRNSDLRSNFSETKGSGVVNGSVSDAATLFIINSRLSGNTGSVIDNYNGTVNVVGGTFNDNVGRAIYNHVGGAVSIVDSTFANNSDDGFAGGALFNNNGQMDIVNSTFTGNYNPSSGGVIGNSGELTIRNSTLVGNHAGGVSSDGRPVATYGGGAIYQYEGGNRDPGSTTLYNTIVAGNYVGTGANLRADDIHGPVEPESAHNLIGRAGTAGGLIDGDMGNLVGNGGKGVIEITTVLLDSNGDGAIDAADLADHGGPTQTLALAENSPAIDAGVNAEALDPTGAPLLTDQRGEPRQQNGELNPESQVDIGAYEARAVFIVNTVEDTPDANPGDWEALDANGKTSLRAAIDEANSRSGRQYIAFDPALAGATITLESPLVIGAPPPGQSSFLAGLAASGEFASIQSFSGGVISDREPTDVRILGLGIDQITIDGAGQTRLFKVLEGRRLSLSELTLTGGSPTESSGSNAGGGAIRNYGSLHIGDARLANNTALEPNRVVGGAIFNDHDATLTIDGATFENNQAEFGGAIYNRGTIEIAGAAFLGNEATFAHGGAIYSRGDHSWQGHVTIADSRFEGNVAYEAAGAIFSSHDTELIVQRSDFVGNQAGRRGNGTGGAIHAIYGAEVTIDASTFTDNRAEAGGAVGVYGDSTLHLSDSVFTGNVAERESGGYGNGGAIQLRSGAESTILHSTFRGNQAGEWGGAISNSGASALTIFGGTFAENVAIRRGGALETVENSPTSIVQSTFVGNQTVGLPSNYSDGGALFVSTDLTLAHTTVVGNRANTGGFGVRGGGGLFIDQGSVTLSHTIIAGNYQGPDLNVDDVGLARAIQDNAENHLTASHSLIGDAATAGGIQDRTVAPDGGNLVGNGGSGVIDVTTILLDRNLDGLIDANDLGEEDGSTSVLGLVEGSVAIDAGDPEFNPHAFSPPMLVDQRGVARVFGERIDLGAVEFGFTSTFVVTSLTDNRAGLTLREAVAFANAQRGADQILFAPHLAGGVIVLTEGQLELTDDIVIQGLGADELTIDANQRDRAFLVHVGVTAELADLSITGGKLESITGETPEDDSGDSDPPVASLSAPWKEDGGGAILNLGALTIRRSKLHGNFTNTNGGAIRNGDGTNEGTLSLVNSQISGNQSSFGGGVTNYHGIVRVTESTFRENVGGAIADFDRTHRDLDTVHIVNSAFTGNTNANDGGALSSNFGHVGVVNSTFAGNTSARNGGALSSDLGRVDIVNSTFVGNASMSLGGAIHNPGSELTVRNSTLAGNLAAISGGAIYQNDGESFSTATLNNTLVAGNYVETEGDLQADDIGGAITPESAYNLIGSAETAGGLIDGANGNLVGDGGIGVIDIMTVVLDANGDGRIDANDLLDADGLTPVVTLASGSAAIDAGDPSFDPHAFTPPLLVDQRGGPRVINGRIDIGAVEFESNPMLLVTSLTDDGSGLTLREAVEIANTRPGADVIGFAPELAGGVIVLIGGQLELTDGVVIQGLGADELTIDANQQGRAFLVHAAVTAELADLSITGGRVDESHGDPYRDGGGAVLNFGSLTIRSSTLHGNSTATYGGAVLNGNWNDAGTLSIINSQVRGNESKIGGGVFNFNGVLRVTDSTLSDNVNGAIYNHVGDTVSIVNSTFTGNTNTRGFAGGALFNNHGRMDIVNSTFTDNTSRFRGGVIGNSGELTIRNSTLVGNRAGIFGADVTGGAIYQYHGEAGDRDGDGVGASGDDSGVEIDLGSTTLYNTIVAGNHVGTSGNPRAEDISGPITPESAYNLIGSAETAGGLIDGANGNLVGNDGSGVIDITTVLFDANGDGRIDADDLLDFGGPTLAFALAAGSAAIDAGDPNFAPDDLTPPRDFDQRGVPRVMNGRLDIGATEFDTAAWQNTAAPSDVNNDAVVNVQDLLFVVQNLREHGIGYALPDRPAANSSPAPFVDVDGNGTCNMADLLSVVQAIRDSLEAGAGEGEVANALPASAKPDLPRSSQLFHDLRWSSDADEDDETAELDAWLTAIAADVTAAHGRQRRIARRVSEGDPFDRPR